jgi:hypothetical protein
MYSVKINYESCNAVVKKAVCLPVLNTNKFYCVLELNYTIDGNNITNQLIMNSDKKYIPNDIIVIDYDLNNYLIINEHSNYKHIASNLMSSGCILLIISFVIYHTVLNNINTQIDKVLYYLPSFLK